MLPADLVSRIANLGVTVCLQPSFAVTDAAQVPVALGADRAATAYPWACLAASRASLLSGTDFPIEVIEPLVGLSRLVNGRSERAGFETGGTAPAQSRLPADRAVAISTDPAAGRTYLSADPVAFPAAELDSIEVRRTEPAPF